MQAIETYEDLNATEESRRAVYAAFASGDARYDGQVFVGVSSTGIYCRTVCSARLPKFENCTFYHTAAEAEAAGFRPCMTCRPEVAPGMAPVDARASLARRAALLLRENCASGNSLETLAARLGYTDRHLRRAFAEEFGVTPVQYLQTCRLLLAKSLLTDSDLSVSQVAAAAGFGSVRRMNHLFKERYHITPTDLRRRRKSERPPSGNITVRLGYRPPYRFRELLAFFRDRALEGVEVIDDASYTRTVHLENASDGMVAGWVRVENDPTHDALAVTMSDSLLPVLPQVIARIRRQFDVDSNPRAIATQLASMDSVVASSNREGTRLPGCFDPFETACRAVLGQQVTVKAANRIAARVADAFGTSIETGVEGLRCAWPSPANVAALDNIEDALGVLGVIKSRSRTIAEIACLMNSGELELGPSTVIEEQMQRLLDIKGIGPWSANYIAMRTMSHPDAFLETDAGVAHALPELTPKARLELAEQWRPWRSYAVINLWNSLAHE